MKKIQGSNNFRTWRQKKQQTATCFLSDSFTSPKHEKVFFFKSAHLLYMYSVDQKTLLHLMKNSNYTHVQEEVTLLGVAAFPDEISGPETGPPGKKFHRQPTKRLLLTLRNELLVSIPFKTSSHQGIVGSWILIFHRHKLWTIWRIEGMYLKESKGVIRKLSWNELLQNLKRELL